MMKNATKSQAPFYYKYKMNSSKNLEQKVFDNMPASVNDVLTISAATWASVRQNVIKIDTVYSIME